MWTVREGKLKNGEGRREEQRREDKVREGEGSVEGEGREEQERDGYWVHMGPGEG